MVTFKRTEGALRDEVQNYLGKAFESHVNVYAAVEDGLVGAGALELDGNVVRISDWKAETEYLEFTLRSLVFVAANTGLDVVGADAQLTRYGFTKSCGVYRCKAADIKFPCECGAHKAEK